MKIKRPHNFIRYRHNWRGKVLHPLSFAMAMLCGSGLNAQSTLIAVNDTFSIYENSPTQGFHVTQNDTDTGGGPLTIDSVGVPQHGFAQLNGPRVINYTVDSSYFGTDLFGYKVCDSLGSCATASIYVIIKGTNLPPIVHELTFTFPDTVGSALLAVLDTDTDPAGDTLYIYQALNFDSLNNLGFVSIDPVSGQLLFTHTSLTCGIDTFGYIVCNLGKCDTGLVIVNVTCPDNIFLPQGFSPNGDGKNDNLVFTNLGYFSPASLKVFNRYGTSVYQNADYQNDWNGTDGDSGKPLPDGTYFYILQLSNNHTYNNYLIINR